MPLSRRSPTSSTARSGARRTRPDALLENARAPRGSRLAAPARWRSTGSPASLAPRVRREASAPSTRCTWSPVAWAIERKDCAVRRRSSRPCIWQPRALMRKSPTAGRRVGSPCACLACFALGAQQADARHRAVRATAHQHRRLAAAGGSRAPRCARGGRCSRSWLLVSLADAAQPGTRPERIAVPGARSLSLGDRGRQTRLVAAADLSARRVLAGAPRGLLPSIRARRSARGASAPPRRSCIAVATMPRADCAGARRGCWSAVAREVPPGMLVRVTGLVQVGMQAPRRPLHTYLPLIGIALALAFSGRCALARSAALQRRVAAAIRGRVPSPRWRRAAVRSGGPTGATRARSTRRMRSVDRTRSAYPGCASAWSRRSTATSGAPRPTRRARARDCRPSYRPRCVLEPARDGALSTRARGVTPASAQDAPRRCARSRLRRAHRPAQAAGARDPRAFNARSRVSLVAPRTLRSSAATGSACARAASAPSPTPHGETLSVESSISGTAVRREVPIQRLVGGRVETRRAVREVVEHALAQRVDRARVEPQVRARAHDPMLALRGARADRAPPLRQSPTCARHLAQRRRLERRVGEQRGDRVAAALLRGAVERRPVLREPDAFAPRLRAHPRSRAASSASSVASRGTFPGSVAAQCAARACPGAAARPRDRRRAPASSRCRDRVEARPASSTRSARGLDCACPCCAALDRRRDLAGAPTGLARETARVGTRQAGARSRTRRSLASRRAQLLAARATARHRCAAGAAAPRRARCRRPASRRSRCARSRAARTGRPAGAPSAADRCRRAKPRSSRRSKQQSRRSARSARAAHAVPASSETGIRRVDGQRLGEPFDQRASMRGSRRRSHRAR